MVMHSQNYFAFKIYVHYVEWSQTRLIWIAFYKNQKNKQCLIPKLPKAVVKNILGFAGPLKTPNREKLALFI